MLLSKDESAPEKQLCSLIVAFSDFLIEKDRIEFIIIIATNAL